MSRERVTGDNLEPEEHRADLSQIDVVRDFITKGVDGICLAPLDSQALLGAVQEAHTEGIPTIVFDSNLVPNEVQVSYVATDNYQGGAKAAHQMAELLKGSK